ncbi:MAG: hypothetical protein RID91_22815 [Azospirillaceae bacterium]
MSIGLATVAVAIFLLPGFGFSFALYAFGRADRDTVPRSRLSEIALAAAAALLFHGIAFIALRWLQEPNGADPAIIAPIAFVIGATDLSAEEAATRIVRHAPWLLAYTASTVLLAMFCAYVVVRIIDHGIGPSALLHGWAAPIIVGSSRPIVRAEIVTRIAHDGRIVMYRGVLSTLRQDRNHKIDYVVLVGVSRLYMRLGRQAPIPDPPNRHMTVRGVHQTSVAPSGQTPGVSRFLIDGEDISNIYFETIPWQGD